MPGRTLDYAAEKKLSSSLSNGVAATQLWVSVDLTACLSHIGYCTINTKVQYLLAQCLYRADTQQIEKYHYEGKDSTFFVDREISVSVPILSLSN